MKKRFFVPACVMAAAAVGFVMVVWGHPELSFTWSARITRILCGLVADAVLLLLVLAFWKETDNAGIPAIVLELGAVFCLVQSMLTAFPEGVSNWYLPLALGLNCAALFLINARRRRHERKEEPEA